MTDWAAHVFRCGFRIGRVAGASGHSYLEDQNVLRIILLFVLRMVQWGIEGAIAGVFRGGFGA